MSKPDNIPQDVWDAALDTIIVDYDRAYIHHEDIARAILTASSQAYSRGLEDAARVASNLHWGFADMGTEGVYQREAKVCVEIMEEIRALGSK